MSSEQPIQEILLRFGYALTTYINHVDLLGHTRPTHSQVYCHELDCTLPEILFIWDFVKWCDGDLEAGERCLQYNRNLMKTLNILPRVSERVPLNSVEDDV